MAHYCPACQKEVDGVNHNGRGHRCPVCWSAVEPVAAKQPETPPAKPKRKGAK